MQTGRIFSQEQSLFFDFCSILVFLNFFVFYTVCAVGDHVKAKNSDGLQTFPLCSSLSPFTLADKSEDVSQNDISHHPPTRQNDISVSNGERRIGILPRAGSRAFIQFTAPNNKTDVTDVDENYYENLFENNDKYPGKSAGYSPLTTCGIRLEACANCFIGVEFESAALHFTEATAAKLSKCDDPLEERPCFNFVMIEERADRQLSLHSSINLGFRDGTSSTAFYRRVSVWDQPTQGAERVFNSSSSSLLIFVAFRSVANDPQFSKYIQRLFPVKVTVYDNTEVIFSHSNPILTSNQRKIGIVHSPRFPEPYPRTLLKNYTLINENASGFVRILFDDFHVHYLSELKIIDSDGLDLFNTRREHRRPPALVSSGNIMTLVFSARAFTQSVGFRARYEFVEENEWPEQPNSQNCDEYLEGYGGRISLDNQKRLINNEIDCIWLIERPLISPTTLDHQIYLKVEEFKLRGSALRLEVRRGSNSGAERILTLFNEQSVERLNSKLPDDGFVSGFPSEERPIAAFYVRLRGYLTDNIGLSIVFAHFYRWATALCPGPNEFHCDNSKCIKNILKCDGYDHCGDFSDEICQLPGAIIDGTTFNIPSLLTIIVGIVSTILIFVMIIVLVSTATRNQLLMRLNGAPLFPPLRRRENPARDGNTPVTSCHFERSSPHNYPTTTDREIIPPASNSCNNYRRNYYPAGTIRNLGSVQNVLNSRQQSTLHAANVNNLVSSTPSIQTIGDRRFYILPPENQLNIIEAPPTYDDALKHPAVPLTVNGAYYNGAFRMSLPEIMIATNHDRNSPIATPFGRCSTNAEMVDYGQMATSSNPVRPPDTTSRSNVSIADDFENDMAENGFSASQNFTQRVSTVNAAEITKSNSLPNLTAISLQMERTLAKSKSMNSPF